MKLNEKDKQKCCTHDEEHPNVYYIYKTRHDWTMKFAREKKPEKSKRNKIVMFA